MKIEELNAKIGEIKKEGLIKEGVVIKEYCDANNPYKVGDKFTDPIGTIIIERINYCWYFSTPCCRYFGIELKKNGSASKNGNKRTAYQSNEVKK